MILSLKDAFQFAQEKHQGQKKPGTQSPYLFHPFGVASLVLKFGGSDSQAAAALLHDTIGDSSITHSTITSRFNKEVADLVFAFADPEIAENLEAMKEDDRWRTLKKAYLGKLPGVLEEALLIIACEELHDLEELLFGVRYEGFHVWDRYPVHGMQVFWYYKELLSLFNKRLSAPKYQQLVSEFARHVRELQGLTMEGNPA